MHGNTVSIVRETVRGHVSYFGSLTEPGREYVGELLAEVVREHNHDETVAGKRRREMVKRAFRHTVLPGHPKNKRLQRKLDACKANGWEPVYTPYPNPTPEPQPTGQ